VLILEPTLRKVEKLILGCEVCSPDEAQLHFDVLLGRATILHSRITFSKRRRSAQCVAPMCRRKLWWRSSQETSPPDVLKSGFIYAADCFTDAAFQPS
jgi:hypothetical protein